MTVKGLITLCNLLRRVQLPCTTTTNVIYRAIINGTSDILTAPELMDLIENWRTTGGTLLYNSKYRLRLAQKEACPLQIESFHASGPIAPVLLTPPRTPLHGSDHLLYANRLIARQWNATTLY